MCDQWCNLGGGGNMRLKIVRHTDSSVLTSAVFHIELSGVRWVHKKCSGISEKAKSNVDFNCERCMERSPAQLVSMREVEIEPNVKKLKCVPKVCNLGDTLGAGVEEVARARVRCA